MAEKEKDRHVIVAIHVTDRVEQASVVQTVLTQYGGFIKTRIGLHEATGKGASPNGRSGRGGRRPPRAQSNPSWPKYPDSISSVRRRTSRANSRESGSFASTMR